MSSSTSSLLSIRLATFEDIKFIMSSWKQSWRVSPWAGVIRNDEYFDVIQSTIDGLIARGATLQVACLESRPERILGWICSEVLPDGVCCIHYIYVKDPYLNQGIGEKLVEAAQGRKPGFYTFRYKQVSEACRSSEGWRHVPEIARRK